MRTVVPVSSAISATRMGTVSHGARILNCSDPLGGGEPWGERTVCRGMPALLLCPRDDRRIRYRRRQRR
ncbi:hypothetical protein BKH30_08950, partial [Actinomyces oris]